MNFSNLELTQGLVLNFNSYLLTFFKKNKKTKTKKNRLMSWQYLFEIIWDLGKDTFMIYFWYVRKIANWPVVGFCVFLKSFLCTEVNLAFYKFDGNTDDAMLLLRLRKRKSTNISRLFLITNMFLIPYPDKPSSHLIFLFL